MGREPGELERTYIQVFQRFARMIAAGDFPFTADDAERGGGARGSATAPSSSTPTGRVEYASPERRVRPAQDRRARQRRGHAPRRARPRGGGDPHGHGHRRAGDRGDRAGPGGHRPAPLRAAASTSGEVTGALVLLRDISELRRRDRLLISMDATIREIHHRVKNNLQTISSLLRLQGRRLESPEAKGAIEESVRRIRSIALVHETLSRETGDDVAFNDIVRPAGADGGGEPRSHPTGRCGSRVEGDAGKLPARVATPLAVVLTELLQNAVDHGYPEGWASTDPGARGRAARQRRRASSGRW